MVARAGSERKLDHDTRAAKPYERALRLHRRRRVYEGLDRRPGATVVAARGPVGRVLAPGALPAWNELVVFEYQLRAARTGHRGGNRQHTGTGAARAHVQPAGAGRYLVSCRNGDRRSVRARLHRPASRIADPARNAARRQLPPESLLRVGRRQHGLERTRCHDLTPNGRRVAVAMVNIDTTHVSWSRLEKAAQTALCSG